MEIYVNFIRVPSAIFKRPPLTHLQNFTVHRWFCPAPISSFPRSVDFSSCSKWQRVAFVRPCPYPNHEEKQVFLFVENQGRADLVFFRMVQTHLVLQQLVFALDVQPDAPDWLMIIAADAAYGHASTGTGSISTGLVWYLLMNPGSAFTTVMVLP